MEDELYRQELLERYKNAPNKRVMIKPDIKAEDSNPLCGDNVEIFIRMGKDGIIKDATFDGKGCVISMASASLLLESIVGKTLKEAEELTREDMLDIIGINLTPTRVKCATLGLATLKKGISESKEKKSSALPATEKSNQFAEDSVARSSKHKLAGAPRKISKK
jgi:nitrogen fixation protein NifU and related proteins